MSFFSQKAIPLLASCAIVTSCGVLKKDDDKKADEAAVECQNPISFIGNTTVDLEGLKGIYKIQSAKTFTEGTGNATGFRVSSSMDSTSRFTGKAKIECVTGHQSISSGYFSTGGNALPYSVVTKDSNVGFGTTYSFSANYSNGAVKVAFTPKIQGFTDLEAQEYLRQSSEYISYNDSIQRVLNSASEYAVTIVDYRTINISAKFLNYNSDVYWSATYTKRSSSYYNTAVEKEDSASELEIDEPAETIAESVISTDEK